MGRYLEQHEGRSELQQRIAAELRAKAEAKSKQTSDSDDDNYYRERDGVDDTAYLQGTKLTTTLAPAWMLVGLMAAGVFGYFVYLVSR